MLTRYLPLVFVLTAGAVQAAGPASFATLDRATWPQPLHSQAAFDTASRAEVLTFAQALQASEALDEAAWIKRLGLKSVNLQSVARVRERFWQRLLENYRLVGLVLGIGVDDHAPTVCALHWHLLEQGCTIHSLLYIQSLGAVLSTPGRKLT